MKIGRRGREFLAGGNGRTAFVILERHRSLGRGGDLGRVRGLGGDEHSQRAVGVLEVSLGHAGHILRGDLEDAVAHQEQQPPVSGRHGFAEIQPDHLRIGQQQVDLLAETRLGVIHFLLGGGLLRNRG